LPLTCAQIVNLACQTAKVPAWTSQAGQLLNAALAEFCTTYDLEVNRQTYTFVFNPGLGSGPYPLPSNWLRANDDDVFFTIQGVAYVMISIQLPEYDALVQQAGLNAYPAYYAIDNSPIQTQQPPNMYVWPPPAGAYPVTARYFCQQPDITTPETSATIPWFPATTVLLRRVAGELMLMANDDRAEAFLSSDENRNPEGYGVLLRKYLRNQDANKAPNQVKLDKRLFKTGRWSALPNTKYVGW